MSCANCGSATAGGNDLCSACQQEHVAVPAPESAPLSAGPTTGTGQSVVGRTGAGATSATALPGWYLDGSDVRQQRYWDGAAWTSSVRDAISSPTWSGGPQAPQVAVKGMSFSQAVRSGLTQYAGFSGRTRRSESWWLTLFY